MKRLICLFVGHDKVSHDESVPTQYSGSYDFVLFCRRCKLELMRNCWGHSSKDHGVINETRSI